MTSPIEQASQMKLTSRGWSDDMDSTAIARRLAIVENLYAAWLTLKKARRQSAPVNPANPEALKI